MLDDLRLDVVERKAMMGTIPLYDGYHFCEDTAGMYNPFSLLNTFASDKFREYWFETGTPTFLVTLLKQTD